MKKLEMCYISSKAMNEIGMVANKEFMEWVMQMLYEESSRETDMVQKHELTGAWIEIRNCLKEMSQEENSNDQTETLTDDSLPF